MPYSALPLGACLSVRSTIISAGGLAAIHMGDSTKSKQGVCHTDEFVPPSITTNRSFHHANPNPTSHRRLIRNTSKRRRRERLSPHEEQGV